MINIITSEDIKSFSLCIVSILLFTMQSMSHGYFYHESHTCSDCQAGNIGILNSHMGSIQTSHQQFGTITRNLQRNNKKKTKTSSFVRNIYVHWNLTRWERENTLHFKTTADDRMKRGEL